MKASIRLGRIFGITIGIHYSWFIVLALLTWSLAQGFLPDQYPGWEPGMYWGIALACSLLLFVCVLVHELAHSLVAKMRGFPVHGITLFILGGVSYLKAEAGRAIDELTIAGAGPLTSFIISGACLLGMLAVPNHNSELHAVLRYLGIANAAIGVFNLIPAFPLDGGRVLRSLIWAGTGKLVTATNIATVCGQAIGLILIAAGIYVALRGYLLQGLWLMMGGRFLQSGATATRKDMAFEEALKKVRVFDVMDQRPSTVEPETTISQVVQDHMVRRGVRALPVTAGDRLVGMLTRGHIIQYLQNRGEMKARRERPNNPPR
ncbi:MAG: CBS domain-containing protein [SAR202 cluster bacterium]|nr:CBS domain-containing protein [SAR202 cluster bacterium]